MLDYIKHSALTLTTLQESPAYKRVYSLEIPVFYQQKLFQAGVLVPTIDCYQKLMSLLESLKNLLVNQGYSSALMLVLVYQEVLSQAFKMSSYRTFHKVSYSNIIVDAVFIANVFSSND